MDAFHYDPSYWEKINHSTTVIINDVEYPAFGTGNANDGLLATQFTHGPKFPFDPEILAIHLIAGYPVYSEYREGATNLFKPSALLGGFKYQRSYKFSNGATWSSYHNIKFDPQTKALQGTFMTRDFPVEKFEGRRYHIQDVVETFIPAGRGQIKSVMVAEWKGDDGRDLQATIESQYSLNHNEKLPSLHWRHLKFATEHKENAYRQSEKMTVMANLSFGSPPPNTILEIEPELAPVVNTKADEPMTQVAVV